MYGYLVIGCVEYSYPREINSIFFALEEVALL